MLMILKSYVIQNWRLTPVNTVVLFRGFAPVHFISPPDYIVNSGRINGTGSYIEVQAGVVSVPGPVGGGQGLRLPDLALYTTMDSNRPTEARWSFAFYDLETKQLIERWRHARDIRLAPDLGRKVVPADGGRPYREVKWEEALLVQPELRESLEL